MEATYLALQSLPFVVGISSVADVAKMQILLWVYLAVHVYGVFYIRYDRTGEQRFFALLGLFLVGMATLMLAKSWLALVLGWETIGLASFGLLAQYRLQNSVARQAAYVFWVNRLGDMALLAGVGLAIAGHPLAVWALVGAAVVKSAQFPFAVWLPWAMVGPLPVSALLHAATLVVSGVVLLTHPLVQPLLQADVLVCQTLTCLAAFTALWAAWQACRAQDLKRLLAFSTIAHVALMMLWPYADAGKASLWHLGSHAFFKTGLFLSLGVLHGNLRGRPIATKQLYNSLRSQPYLWPLTVLLLVFVAALVGLGPFAGHYSKSALLFAPSTLPFFTKPWALQARAWLAAVYLVLTAIYASRFLLAYVQLLVTEKHKGAMLWATTALLGVLVPFLFWQPFAAMGSPQVTNYPSARWPDVWLAVGLGIGFLLALRQTKAAGKALPVGLATTLGQTAQVATKGLGILSLQVQRLDTALARVVVGFAHTLVVLAWVLARAETIALLIVRGSVRMLIEPLRWLVDDTGRLGPNRMVWAGMAVALSVLWLVW